METGNISADIATLTDGVMALNNDEQLRPNSKLFVSKLFSLSIHMPGERTSPHRWRGNRDHSQPPKSKAGGNARSRKRKRQQDENEGRGTHGPICLPCLFSSCFLPGSRVWSAVKYHVWRLQWPKPHCIWPCEDRDR